MGVPASDAQAAHMEMKRAWMRCDAQARRQFLADVRKAAPELWEAVKFMRAEKAPTGHES